MSFRIVDPNLPLYPIDPENPSLAPAGKSGIEYLPDHSLGKFLPVQKKVGVLGETLQDARVSLDPQNGKPNVSLEFNVLGARQFEQVTRENKGKLCAIVLDNEIISAPSLNVVIPNGRAVITSSSFTIQTANDLALLLRAGALPAPLKVVDERTIGPSLGADSIHDGKKAVFLAFIFVSVFMTLSYGIFGLFANISLLFNIIFLFSGLSLLQATLTLPGIAGIALTIGMAVDANVLIYERIKEELRAGLKPVNAVEAGYKLAMMTIIDSNITTLFGAAVLFEFGSGPIRGFAVTLALGILISLFTALSLSKTS
jgi:preprotein translocase subunit SecD